MVTTSSKPKSGRKATTPAAIAPAASPAPIDAPSTTSISPEGASGTAREAPSAGSGPDALLASGGAQPAPPHVIPEGQQPADDSAAEAHTARPVALTGAGAEEVAAPNEEVAAADDTTQTGKVAEVDAAATSVVAPARRRFVLSRGANGAVDMKSVAIEGREVGILAYRFVEVGDDELDHVIIVTVEGRKYRASAQIAGGTAVDTATDEVLELV